MEFLTFLAHKKLAFFDDKCFSDKNQKTNNREYELELSNQNKGISNNEWFLKIIKIPPRVLVIST